MTPTAREWHVLPASEVVDVLSTDASDGLTASEVKKRQEQDGPNKLPESKHRHAILRFLDQFKEPLVVVLLIAAALTIGLGSFADASVILGVVLLNAIVGFIQEGKAVKALSALSSSMSIRATALRDGTLHSIDASELVVGDVVQLEAGERIPADLRILRSRDLRVDESSLTGESTLVGKSSSVLSGGTVLAERTNMVYASTVATAGSGFGVVTAIGSATEIGQISRMIDDTKALTTPLTRTIARFSTYLLWGIVFLAILSFAIGMLRGEEVLDMVLASVALAVGAIPEGLPAAVTIILAIGVSRLAKRKAIVRQLPAVETLGSTTIICSDKTGTLTQNQMTVTRVITASCKYHVSGTGFEPKGTISCSEVEDGVENDGALQSAVIAGALCGTSSVAEESGLWKAIGDPTEAALVVLAMKTGHNKSQLEKGRPLIDIIPFSSDKRFMATLHEVSGQKLIYLKGSVEAILKRCSHMMLADGTKVDLRSDDLYEDLRLLTENGMRVLAIAEKELVAATKELDHVDVEDGCTLTALVAMIDPPRPEVKDSIAQCRSANISVKMITGDHVATATNIASRLGLGDGGVEPVSYTGADLEAMSDDEFDAAAIKGQVFARVSPAQKLQLVESLQAHGHVVAMTGDGVNDAPALRRSDIGVAMGVAGTEVAKDASDIVLTDDNFVTIVNAVREGRVVFDNIRKFIVWSLPTNVGEGLVILTAIALGITLPILPIQILWINMTTAVILGIPLAFEPARTDVMERLPRQKGAPLLRSVYVIRTFIVGAFLLVGAFTVFSLEVEAGSTLETARTAAANALVLMEAFYLYNVRMLTLKQKAVKGASNPWIWLGVGVTLSLQVMFTYAPFMNSVFHTEPVGVRSWLISIGCGLAVAVVIEAEKLIRKSLGKN